MIVTCPDEHDEVCSKVYYDHELHERKTHTKFCEKKSQCTQETNPICKAAKTHKAKCKAYCCTSDLCNPAVLNLVSGILMMACAVVSMRLIWMG